MVTCLTIEIANGETIPHGAKSYETLPRLGELVALEENGNGFLFEIVAVAHAANKEGCGHLDGADLYIKRLGSEVDVLSRLVQKGA